MEKNAKLDRNLTLFDVYAMSTGAMFSSGLFLLPGIAAASTGNSVFLAYLLAGLLILPAMYAMAELSTAMPKAGGTYYFLDRAMGPLMGTIGGLGSWVAVVFKSAFALVGMGAPLSESSLQSHRDYFGDCLWRNQYIRSQRDDAITAHLSDDLGCYSDWFHSAGPQIRLCWA